MNRRQQLKIANRMSALLQRELGQGIDVLRMSADPLYARDVLLVCDALDGSTLAALAEAFRKVTSSAADDGAAAESSGFSASRFFSSIFGAHNDPGLTRSNASTLDGTSPQLPRPRRWFGREGGR
jgi:hypothetical protein